MIIIPIRRRHRARLRSSRNRSKTAVEPAPAVAGDLSLDRAVFVEVTMPGDSNVDTERLWMTKMRMTRMMTDGYIQTHHQCSVIQIQLNEPEATHSVKMNCPPSSSKHNRSAATTGDTYNEPPQLLLSPHIYLGGWITYVCAAKRETVRLTDYSTVVHVNGDTADGLSCIECVNNGILPFVERMVGRILVILGDGAMSDCS